MEIYLKGVVSGHSGNSENFSYNWMQKDVLTIQMNVTPTNYDARYFKLPRTNMWLKVTMERLPPYILTLSFSAC